MFNKHDIEAALAEMNAALVLNTSVIAKKL